MSSVVICESGERDLGYLPLKCLFKTLDSRSPLRYARNDKIGITDIFFHETMHDRVFSNEDLMYWNEIDFDDAITCSPG